MRRVRKKRHAGKWRAWLILSASIAACGSPMSAGLEDDGVDASVGSEVDDKALAACPTFSGQSVMGHVQASAVKEASGIVASRGSSGVLWTHNDSGDSARVFALTQSGNLIATVKVNNASARDWEDIATGPGPNGKHYIYVADIGDNGKQRGQYQIYRFVEPSISASQRNLSLSVNAERMDLKYPTGSRNAETFMVDPVTGELVIVIKGDGTYVYGFGSFAAGATRTGTQIAQINQAHGGVDTAVGGEISPDGSSIIVKDYSTTGKLWRRSQGSSLSSAFGTASCNVPMPSEPQGEAVGFAADGSGYFTLSEGASQPIYLVKRR